MRRAAAVIRSPSWRIHSGPIQVAGVRLRAALRRAIRRRRGHPTQGEHSCSSRKFWDSPLSARCSRSQRQPSAPMRCRSVIPAPPRRFRKIPDRRQRKCIGGITAITVGTITIADTTTIIIATGTAGERGSLTHRTGPVRWACFRLGHCHETGEIAACNSITWRRGCHEEPDGDSSCRGYAHAFRFGSDRFGLCSAAGEDASCRNFRRDGFRRAPASPASPSSLRLSS